MANSDHHRMIRLGGLAILAAGSWSLAACQQPRQGDTIVILPHRQGTTTTRAPAPARSRESWNTVPTYQGPPSSLVTPSTPR